MVRQLRRFAVTGLLATGVHVAVAALLIELAQRSPPFANGAAFLVATAFSYAMNTLWSFSATPGARSLARFAVVSCVGWTLTVLLSALADRLGLHYLLGIGLVVTGVPPVTFLLHRYWTYR